MNARLNLLRRREDVRRWERQIATYWLNKLRSAAETLFPKMSYSMREKWVQAKLYIADTLPKVRIGCRYGMRKR